MSSEVDPEFDAPHIDSVEGFCAIIVGWISVCSTLEHQLQTARYYLVLTSIGFGAVVCSILSNEKYTILGFIFLLCTFGFAIYINHSFDRMSKAWSKSRAENENLSRYVGSYGSKILMCYNALDFKTPTELYNEFKKEYSARPLDPFSKSVYLIGCLVFLCTAYIISDQFGIYVKIGMGQ